MAMNGNTWGTAVKNAILAVVASEGIEAGVPVTESQIEKLWQAICTAHDTHISNNATVSVTVTSVSTGINTAPGTGTVT